VIKQSVGMSMDFLKLLPCGYNVRGRLVAKPPIEIPRRIEVPKNGKSLITSFLDGRLDFIWTKSGFSASSSEG